MKWCAKCERPVDTAFCGVCGAAIHATPEQIAAADRYLLRRLRLLAIELAIYGDTEETP